MNDDPGFDVARAAAWFPHDKEKPYILVRVSDEHAKATSSTRATDPRGLGTPWARRRGSR